MRTEPPRPPGFAVLAGGPMSALAPAGNDTWRGWAPWPGALLAHDHSGRNWCASPTGPPFGSRIGTSMPPASCRRSPPKLSPTRCRAPPSSQGRRRLAQAWRRPVAAPQGRLGARAREEWHPRSGCGQAHRQLRLPAAVPRDAITAADRAEAPGHLRAEPREGGVTTDPATTPSGRSVPPSLGESGGAGSPIRRCFGTSEDGAVGQLRVGHPPRQSPGLALA